MNDPDIGTDVHTKQLGGKGVESVANKYKPDEGSPEEKGQVVEAVSHGTMPNIYKETKEEPLKDDIFVVPEVPKVVKIGDNIPFEFEVEAGSKWNVSCFAKTYAGIVTAEVLVEDITDSQFFGGELKFNQYGKYALNGDYLEFRIFCESHTAVASPCYPIKFETSKPVLKILSQPPYVIGRPIDLEFSFTNELPIPLTNWRFAFLAPKLKKQSFYAKNPLQSGETKRVHLIWVPKRPGTFDVILQIIAAEIASIQAHSVSIQIDKEDAVNGSNNQLPEQGGDQSVQRIPVPSHQQN